MGEATVASVPLIDIAAYPSWDAVERRTQAKHMRGGFKLTGFVQTQEDPAFTQSANAICMRLMMRPMEELLAYYDAKKAGVRGYTPLFSETALKEGSVPDVKHFFDVPIFDVGAPRFLPTDVARDILWLREDIKRRVKMMLSLIAVSYDLPENHFVDLAENSEHSIMRFLAYPGLAWTATLLSRVVREAEETALPVTLLARSFLLKLGFDIEQGGRLPDEELHAALSDLVGKAQRSGEHTDMGFLTALVTSTAEGLYIVNGGTALPLSTEADRLTFNAGDMAVEYTSYYHPEDPMASTLHGVKPSADQNAPRFALAAFVHFRRDVRLNLRWAAGEFHDFMTKKTILPG